MNHPDQLTSDQIQRWRHRSLTADELRRLDSHLAECADCRKNLAAGLGLADAFAELHAVLAPAGDSLGEHVEYDEMIAYLDGTLGERDRGIIEFHLETCVDCSAEFAEMRHLLASDLATVRSAALEGQQSLPDLTCSGFPDETAELNQRRERGPAESSGSSLAAGGIASEPRRNAPS